jgi:phage shock protein E
MKALFCIIFFVFYLSACGQTGTKIQNLSPGDFVTKMKSTRNKQLLDVRTPDEWSQGKIGTSNCIDYNSGDFKTQIQKLDKQKPVFVYCAAGGRSAKASKILEEQGFKQIYNLTGGGYNNLVQAGIK